MRVLPDIAVSMPEEILLSDCLPVWASPFGELELRGPATHGGPAAKAGMSCFQSSQTSSH